MAQRTVVKMTDDLDGGPADETVQFGIDGQLYEMDLSADHAQELRAILSAYSDKARRVGAGKGSRGGGRSGGGRAASSRSGGRRPDAARSSVDNAAVRAWAREQGLEVSPRGRISSEVLARYEEAHQQ